MEAQRLLQIEEQVEGQADNGDLIDIDPQILAVNQDQVASGANAENNHLPEDRMRVPRQLAAWLSAQSLNRTIPARYVSQYNRNMPAHDLRERTSISPSCKALHWVKKRVHSSTINSPRIETCCKDGHVVLPSFPVTPEGLYQLWTSEERDAKEFR